MKKQKIIERLVKQMAKGNKRLSMAHPQSDGRYAFIDGVSIYFSDTDYGYENANPSFDALRVLKGLKYTDTATIDPDEIKTFIKTQGLRRNGSIHKAYIFKTNGCQYVGANPFYLIDLIDYTGCNEVHIASPKKPILGADDSILCPVNIGDYYEERYEEWRKNNL